MALCNYNLEAISKVYKKIQGKKLLLISYTDIMCREILLYEMFGKELITNCKYRSDEESADAIKWHKAYSLGITKVIDTVDFFQKLGFEVTVTDIVKARGVEEYLDLNIPVIHDLKTYLKYDFIIENVMDHVFNIGEGIKNIWRMCAVGGYIIHINMLNTINHGFYGLSPTLYYDFYEANGCEIVDYTMTTSSDIESKTMQVRWEGYWNRMTNISYKAVSTVTVKKVKETLCKYPLQKKFQLYPESK